MRVTRRGGRKGRRERMRCVTCGQKGEAGKHPRMYLPPSFDMFKGIKGTGLGKFAID